MRWLIGVAVAGLALAAVAQAASADELVRAEPGPDAMLAEAPHQVLLTFDRPLAALAGDGGQAAWRGVIAARCGRWQQFATSKFPSSPPIHLSPLKGGRLRGGWDAPQRAAAVV